ncbi:MAG: thioredoxin [Bacteroidales bacterium]
MKRGIGIVLGLVLVLSISCNSQAKTNETSENTVEVINQEKKEANMSNVVNMNKEMFLAKVANYETNPKEWKYLGDKPALIDFYATWCGPCKAIAPVLDELATEYGDSIVIYKIDTDKEQELAALFGIRSIPSLLFIPMDGQPQMSAGAMSKAQLKEAIDNILLKK